MPRRLALAVLATAIAAVALAPAPVSGSGGTFDFVGTWTGDYRFPLGVPITLAAARTVPSAVKLGRRDDPGEVQSRLARRIHADHGSCLAGITLVLVLQVGWVR